MNKIFPKVENYEIEHLPVPWASKANGWWNGDMFEDWLRSASSEDSDGEVELRNFFIRYTEDIKKQAVDEYKKKVDSL